MKEKLTVSLFGHRIIEDYNAVEAKLYELLRILMQKGSREIEFLVGRNGDFDLMAASVIRKLKKETGKSFSRILLEKRMAHALVLLQGTALPIDMISAMLGYSNPSNFHKAFREYYGKAPREYAKEIKQV